MCGRFAFHSPREAITRIFGVDFPLALEPRYNIAPSQYVIALRHKDMPGDGADDDVSLEPVMLRWGLVPFWAKDAQIGNRMINARLETVAEKPAFRAAFRRRRCAILADGFYEWRKEKDGKTPYFISAEAGQPFAMAGLWETWDADGSMLETCTIITTAANSIMAPLHHRMPVLLAPDDVRHWVDPANDSKTSLKAFLEESGGVDLRFWAVSREVNNPANDGPGLIGPN